MAIHESASIHPTAVVHEGAYIGAGVQIGPFCHVQSDTRIADGCRLDGSVTICRYTELGDGCHVHAGAVLGGTPQDLAFDPATVSHVRVGRNCVIREGVTIHRGTGASTETTVGDDCFLMANSHVGHNSRVGNRVILVNGSLLAGHVELGDGAIISGNSTIHQHCRVGRLVMVSGLSGTSKDIPPFCIVPSSRPNRVAGINVVGLRRAGFSSDERTAVKNAFRTIFRGNLNIRDGVRALREGPLTPAVEELCAFIEQSKRGVCRYADGGATDE